MFGFSVHGILQARILKWIAISLSRGSSWPRDWTWVSCIAGRLPFEPSKALQESRLCPAPRNSESCSWGLTIRRPHLLMFIIYPTDLSRTWCWGCFDECYGLKYIPRSWPTSRGYIESLTPRRSNMNLFGKMVIADGIKLRGDRTEVGQTLIQYDWWCPYQKREDGRVKAQTQEENAAWWQGPGLGRCVYMHRNARISGNSGS